MQTELLKQLKYEKDFFSNKDYHGQTVGVICRVYQEEYNLKPLLADSKERVTNAFGDNQELVNIYNEVTKAGCDFVYLLGVYYQNKKEKFDNIQAAYEVLNQLDIDIVVLNNVSIDEYIYTYPEISDKIEVDFTGKVIKNNKVIKTKDFTTALDTNQSTQIIGDLLFKQYFDITSTVFDRKLEISNGNSFKYFNDEELSNNIEIENNLLTVSNRLTSDNKIMEYHAEGRYITEEIESSKLSRFGSKFKNMTVNIDGEFDFTANQDVEIYYYENDGYKKIPNDKLNETITLSSQPETIKFKIVLKNYLEKTNPPTITNFRVDFELLIKDKNITYRIDNPNQYIRFRVDKDGESYVRAKVDTQQFIADHRHKAYFIEELAKKCRKYNMLGLAKSPAIRDNETKDDLYSKLVDTAQFLTNNLDNSTRKHIGCVISQTRYSHDEDTYWDSGINGLAGLFGSYSSDTSPTNKDTVNIIDCNSIFTNEELKNLTELGYTFFTDTVRNGIVPYKVVSFANQDSIYYSLNTTRVVNELVKKIQDVTDRYVGKIVSKVVDKVNKEVNKILTEMNNNNKISNHSFEISEISENSIELEIECIPTNEIFAITTSVKSEK